MELQRVLEHSRRFYGELVKRRTRVRVVAQSSRPLDSSPNFIMSPYRSGTTLLRYCLDSHSELACPPESDFMVNLLGIVNQESSITGLYGLGYERAAVKGSVADYARSFLDTYARGQGKANWIDKSPRYAEHAHEFAELFNDAKFVVLHRHPLDQINSMTKSGAKSPRAFGMPAVTGKDAFLNGARYWAVVTERLIQLQENFGDRTITISYDELCAKPEETLRKVLSHLQLDWEPQVLDYHRFDHDLGKEAGRVRGTVGFSMAEKTWIDLPADWISDAWKTVQVPASKLGFATPS